MMHSSSLLYGLLGFNQDTHDCSKGREIFLIGEKYKQFVEIINQNTNAESLYRIAFAKSLQRHVIDEYISDLVKLEKDILESNSDGLVLIETYVRIKLPLFNDLYQKINPLVKENKFVTLLDGLRRRTGNLELDELIENINTDCLFVLNQQLRYWLNTGDVFDPFSEFFITINTDDNTMQKNINNIFVSMVSSGDAHKCVFIGKVRQLSGMDSDAIVKCSIDDDNSSIPNLINRHYTHANRVASKAINFYSLIDKLKIYFLSTKSDYSLVDVLGNNEWHRLLNLDCLTIIEPTIKFIRDV
ncbi:hypothetical protein GJ496_007185 [Pomphorhynchus laevis]|nr:hypothetical protein GJ496_007185 [Pomphorhynchus laevis]